VEADRGARSAHVVPARLSRGAREASRWSDRRGLPAWHLSPAGSARRSLRCRWVGSVAAHPASTVATGRALHAWHPRGSSSRRPTSAGPLTHVQLGGVIRRRCLPPAARFQWIRRLADSSRRRKVPSTTSTLGRGVTNPNSTAPGPPAAWFRRLRSRGRAVRSIHHVYSGTGVRWRSHERPRRPFRRGPEEPPFSRTGG
jgi:hypothetical protein